MRGDAMDDHSLDARAARSDRADVLDAALAAYTSDWSWIRRVMEYTGLDEVALSELIACFFPDRRRDGSPLTLPEWSDWRESRPDDYARRSAEVCVRRGWDADMSVLGIVHLEFLAHEPDRLALTWDWLEALESLAVDRRPVHTLDFGCGVSHYSELALGLWPGVRSTLADVDPTVVDYLRVWYAKFGDQVRHVALPAHGRISKRSRVEVDHRILSDRYDAIVMSDVLEHTLDPMAVLVHMLGLISPGGLLFINYPHYIEGDWHTPEAYAMRPLCMRYLRRTCRQSGSYVWWELGTPRLHPKRLALKWLRPLERARAKRFAKRYFREHGAELVEQVVTRARRTLTVDQLIASVDP
jgi:SAM-dependent methyltransferase